MNHSFLQTMRALQFAYVDTQPSQLRNKRLVVVVVVAAAAAVVIRRYISANEIPRLHNKDYIPKYIGEKVCNVFCIIFKAYFSRLKSWLSRVNFINILRSFFANILSPKNCKP